MGYFSNCALDYGEDYEDYSYPSPDRQLIWRIEDLKSRWEELKEYTTPHPKYDEGLRLPDNDVRYALPEYFKSVKDVERAVALAISDLRTKYNIEMNEESADEEQSVCENPIVGQLRFNGFGITKSNLLRVA